MTATPFPEAARSAGAWVPVTGVLFQHAPLSRGAEIGRILLTFEPAYRDDLLFLFRLMRRLNALLRRAPRGADEEDARDRCRIWKTTSRRRGPTGAGAAPCC
jgi:hypothetical protein